MKGYLANPVTRSCGICGAEFSATRPQSRYCSTACSKAALPIYRARFKERHPDRVKANSRAQYLKNREHVLARTKAYHKSPRGREVIAESQRRQRALNPEKFRARDAVRRAKEGRPRSADLANAIAEILKLQKGRCAYCRIKLPRDPGGWDLDHIVALANGGTNDRSNLQCLCQKCNASKGRKDPIDFSRQMGLLL